MHYRLVVQERNNSRAVECYSINGLKWARIYYHSRLAVSTEKCKNTHSFTNELNQMTTGFESTLGYSQVSELMKKQRYVDRLMKSMRGRIILGTALYVAIGEMEKVEGAMRQYSTIEDMKSILESDHVINIHDEDD